MPLLRDGLGFPIQLAGTTAATLYDNPTGTKAYIRGLLVHNIDAGAVVFQAYMVPNNTGSLGTAGTTNKILETSIASKETMLFEVPFSLVLTAEHDSIQAASSVAAACNVVLCGDLDQ